VLSSVLYFLLLVIGAVTIVGAVYMAIIQRDMKKLLSYCAISQVGYMILGIGTGTALGITGGVFHMLNHAVYKSGLFLTAGAVEYRSKSTLLDRLGGLSRYMPLSFICCVIFALSIAGVPPLSGFVSKWMIYQSLIARLGDPALPVFARFAYCLFVAFAMFGSALTLAIFIKLIHAVFLGQPCYDAAEMKQRYSEVPFAMALPLVLLAFLCIIFGLFATPVALKLFVQPALSTFGIGSAAVPGLWQSDVATALIFVGLLAGGIIFFFMRAKIRYDRQFIGGEELAREERVTGEDFYRTVQELGFFRLAYSLARKKVFDLYELGIRCMLALGALFSKLHTGNLVMYVFWFFIGLFVIYIALLR
jgi:multicomponent Na+:H+ antiporter subunit A